MYSPSVSAIIVLFLTDISRGLAENICQKYLRELAKKQSDFVQCSTLHSVPVSLCVGCEEPFTEMHVAYMTLRQEQNCTDKFFDKDRINIVSTTQSILVGIWRKAYCDDCFTSNNSYVFDLKRTAFDDCITNNKNRECASCISQYLDLNEFYLGLDKNNKGQVCYDMQDSMNRTREEWSKDLGCCHREFNILLFAVVSCIVGTLPLIFYGTLYAITKRQERNHSIIEDTYQNGTSTSNNASSSIPNLLSTTTEATRPHVPL
ncbi:PREDICTED: osteopetrosis-associated transmembrane protein 1-like [Bactrocera latifrons]|uniref:Osteopetrosis-associated transmembrane protein 1 n=2 Tax=Bactrocera latifrons TaxID=174628 RepID=A0A0K8WAH7_BACLA|nr:PREDICTED: osteopetrosis-associated transmembrane protein 1-like [Bactrocera latifrons]